MGETRQNNHTLLKISHTQGHFSRLGLTLRLGPFFFQCIVCGTQINMYYICAMWAGGKRQRSGSTVKTAKKSGNL